MDFELNGALKLPLAKIELSALNFTTQMDVSCKSERAFLPSRFHRALNSKFMHFHRADGEPKNVTTMDGTEINYSLSRQRSFASLCVAESFLSLGGEPLHTKIKTFASALKD